MRDTDNSFKKTHNLLFLALLGVVLSVVLADFFACSLEQQIRLSGMLLQLLGLAIVVAGVNDNLNDLGQPNLIDRASVPIKSLRQTLKRLLNPEVTGDFHSIAADAKQSASASVSMRKIISVQEQLDELERLMRIGFDELKESQRLEIRRLEKESSTRIDAISQKLEIILLGGFKLELLGVVWLLIATVCTSIPELVEKIIGKVAEHLVFGLIPNLSYCTVF